MSFFILWLMLLLLIIVLMILEQEIDKVLQENEEILKKGIVKNSINKQAQEAF